MRQDKIVLFVSLGLTCFFGQLLNVLDFFMFSLFPFLMAVRSVGPGAQDFVELGSVGVINGVNSALPRFG